MIFESEDNMIKIIRFILAVDRKRRCRTVRIALWLLKQVCDVEKNKMYTYSDKLDQLDLDHDNVSTRIYDDIEEKYLTCECSFDSLESAIKDIEFVY
jgi:hypothetical protein